MTPLSKKSPVLLVENSKSHGSVTVRFGAIIFGLGTFVYFFIELLDFLQIKMWDSDILSIRDLMSVESWSVLKSKVFGQKSTVFK